MAEATVDPSNIYQFKITLKGAKPPIWRRIQVPEDYNFLDLHKAIQSAMGWMDCHLHQFTITNPNYGHKEIIGTPDDDGFMDVVPEETAEISKYFLGPKAKATYIYDFGDSWQHEILLEKIEPANPDLSYPICIAGKRAGPPEDAGGIWGYKELLEIMADPNHEEYKDRKAWLEDLKGENFDPEAFDPKSVQFGCSLM